MPDGGGSYLSKGQWEINTSFLYFRSDKHYIGMQPNLRINAYDGPVNIRKQFNFDLAYGLTSRWDVALDVPFQTQSYDLHRVVKASGSSQPVPVNTESTGIGDIVLRTGRWMFSTDQSKGNVYLSAGLKFPTGSSDATSLVYGRPVPVDISVQPGDGAWGFIPTIEGFRNFKWVTTYGVATYLINPKNTTNTTSFFSTLNNPHSTQLNSSADQFLVEFGGSFPTPIHWLSPTVAYRISGVPPLDLIGKSEGFRRPATLGYIAPGINIYAFGRSISLTFPIVTYINVKPHYVNGVNANTDATIPGFMFSVSYPIRFGGGSTSGL